MLRIPIPSWKTEGILIQDVNELPNWTNATNLYLDVETTSLADKEKSTNPWHNCKLLGVSVLVDEEKCPIYIPLRHRGANHYQNLGQGVATWIQEVLGSCKQWVNHNIKYDMHVLRNEGFSWKCGIVDTLVLCKLAPKEERFTYNLTDIMREWFYTDISYYEELIKSKLPRGVHDYGLIPIDIMCPYSCVDVLSVREIYKQMQIMIDTECKPVLDVEQAVTSVLFDIECKGMKLNLSKVVSDYQIIPLQLQIKQLQIEELTDYSNMRVHTNADCKELFINRYGLPVLEYTEDKKPSFGSDALLAYKAYKPELASAIDLMLEYKELFKLWSSFTKPYLELHVNSIIHPDYNQIVRTGRMSCKKPNMQQLSPAAREYIIPSAPDRVIVDIDYSQIEFRLIAHFVQATKILREYAVNPAADYHQIVANLCSIDRTPAKRVNFMLGYGGGRGKCIEILASIPSIIGELKERNAIERRANEVYETYHKMVPTLRGTTWKASQIMRQRGYVKTLLKRRRYLPRKAHFKAFNTAVQGSAADLYKAALVRLRSSLPPDVYLIGCVHDSFVLDMPAEGVEYEVAKLVKVVEELPEGVTLRVPIRADAKWSSVNWRSCK